MFGGGAGVLRFRAEEGHSCVLNQEPTQQTKSLYVGMDQSLPAERLNGHGDHHAGVPEGRNADQTVADTLWPQPFHPRGEDAQREDCQQQEVDRVQSDEVRDP